MYHFLLPILLAALITIVLIITLNPLAVRFGWVDKPDNLRKLHGFAVPLTGGVAMMTAYTITLLLLDKCHGSCHHMQLLASLIVLCIIGVWDDVRHLSAGFRFFLQACVAFFLVISADIPLHYLGNIFGLGDIYLPEWAAVAFAVFCIVGVINAMNMIDGMDGLAGGLALIGLLGAGFFINFRHFSETLIVLTLLGCLSGYLMFNLRGPLRKRASIFMGDAGSMMLGAAISWALISLSQPTPKHASIIPPVMALWLLAIPLLDTICLIIRRKFLGKSPFTADRDHLHHTLKDAGLSDSHTTIGILLFASVITGLGIYLWSIGTSEFILLMTFLGMGCAYYIGTHQKRWTARFFAKVFNSHHSK